MVRRTKEDYERANILLARLTETEIRRGLKNLDRLCVDAEDEDAAVIDLEHTLAPYEIAVAVLDGKKRDDARKLTPPARS